MSLNDRQLHELALPLNPDRVAKLPPGHPAAGMPYLPIDDVISRANEIFGFGGWSSELVGQPYLLAQGEADGKNEVWAAVVRVTIPEAGASYTDIGTNTRSGKGPAALEMAVKGAVSDGVKRALVYLGDQFGLVLRDKESDRATLHAHWQAAMQRDAAPVAHRPAEPLPLENWRADLAAVMKLHGLRMMDLCEVIPVALITRENYESVVGGFLADNGYTPAQLVKAVLAQREQRQVATAATAAAIPDDDAEPLAAPDPNLDDELDVQMDRLNLGPADISRAIGGKQANPANVAAYLANRRWSARELAEYAAELKRRHSAAGAT